jgi:hypothetical protein
MAEEGPGGLAAAAPGDVLGNALHGESVALQRSPQLLLLRAGSIAGFPLLTPCGGGGDGLAATCSLGQKERRMLRLLGLQSGKGEGLKQVKRVKDSPVPFRSPTLACTLLLDAIGRCRTCNRNRLQKRLHVLQRPTASYSVVSVLQRPTASYSNV